MRNLHRGMRPDPDLCDDIVLDDSRPILRRCPDQVRRLDE